MSTKNQSNILISCLLFCSAAVFAQQPVTFRWARNMGSIDSDAGYAVTSDAAGNVYTTGRFGGTADFDPGAGVFNLTAASPFDIFISKLNAAGNFVWAKRIGG